MSCLKQYKQYKNEMQSTTLLQLFLICVGICKSENTLYLDTEIMFSSHNIYS